MSLIPLGMHHVVYLQSRTPLSELQGVWPNLVQKTKKRRFDTRRNSVSYLASSTRLDCNAPCRKKKDHVKRTHPASGVPAPYSHIASLFTPLRHAPGAGEGERAAVVESIAIVCGPSASSA